jgi:hypothetical protein
VTEVAHKAGESLVLCEPLTGRTHQIRLHLRHLGAPIANDPLYGPSAEAGAGVAEAGPGAKRPGAETEEALGAKRAKAGEGGTGAGLEGAGSGGGPGADGSAGAAGVVLEERAQEDAALGLDAHPEWCPPALRPALCAARWRRWRRCGAHAAARQAGRSVHPLPERGAPGLPRLLRPAQAESPPPQPPAPTAPPHVPARPPALDQSPRAGACARGAREMHASDARRRAGGQHDDSAVMFIWLHALTNAGSSWSYAAPLPSWYQPRPCFRYRRNGCGDTGAPHRFPPGTSAQSPPGARARRRLARPGAALTRARRRALAFGTPEELAARIPGYALQPGAGADAGAVAVTVAGAAAEAGAMPEAGAGRAPGPAP